MTVSVSERLKSVKALGRAPRASFSTDGRLSGAKHLANLLGFKKFPNLSTAGISSNGWGWLPFLVLNAAFSLVIFSVAFSQGRAGSPWATDLFWLGLVVLYLPIALRLLREDVSREERIGLVVLLGTALYLVKVLQSPTAFIQFDEFLHVRTAIDILEKDHLFSRNSLLPVSPLYPGLEIATTAIANLTGLSIFWSGVLLLFVARVVFVLSLFLLIEIVSESARVAGIASLIYMAHSGFLFFHAMFAYESLAIMFFGLLLLSETFTSRSPKFIPPLLCMTLPFLAALTVTHHLTSAFAAMILLLLAFAHMVCYNSRQQVLRAVAIACIVILLLAAWTLRVGNSVESYVAPVFDSGWLEFSKLLTGESNGRKLFVAEDGSGLPAWQRYAALAAVAFTSLGLAIGFFRTLALQNTSSSSPVEHSRLWPIGIGNNARAVLLAALTLGYPISVLLRLTRAGWEIGNRAGAFIYFGVGLVCAVGIAAFWLRGSKSKLRTSAVGVVLTIIFVGGAISGSAKTAVPSGYKVSADALSVEPIGVAAAAWTKETLGRGWRFAADRINRLLLSTYGEQRVITGLQDKLDVSSLVLGDELSAEDMNTITSGKVDFLMVDARLAKALPLVGVYFETGEDPLIHEAPPSSEALRKFNRLRGVGRTFDNGPIAIYDVRSLHARQ
jgi:hypothetical protein